MYHLVNNLATRAGDALVGYYVKLKDSEGAYATLYSDANSTPIATVSGETDAALTDDQGMYDLWVADGDYDIEFFDKNDITQLVSRIPAVPMYGLQATADLSAAVTAAETAQAGAEAAQAAVYGDLASTDPAKGAALVSTEYDLSLANWITGRVVSPEMYGAIGDGSADDTAAIIAALASGARVVGLGHYKITSAVALVDYNRIRLARVTLSGAGACFTNTAGFRNGEIIVDRLTNENGSGDVYVFDAISRDCLIHFGYVSNQDAAARVFYLTADGHSYHNHIKLDSHFNATQAASAASACAPALYRSAPGARFSGNVIEFGFVYGSSTNPIVHVETTDAVQNHSNEYYIRVAEIPDGGVIWLGGESNSLVRVGSYDAATISGDQVRLYTSASATCFGVTVHYERTTGTLNPSVYDINLSGAEGCNVHCPAWKSTSAALINNSDNRGNVIHDNPRWPSTVTEGTVRLSARISDLRDLRPGNNLTIASGVVTLDVEATGEVCIRDLVPESGSADQVDSISGGRDGQIVVFRTTSAAHTITFAHSASILLGGQTNKAINATGDRLVLQRIDGVWHQIGYRKAAAVTTYTAPTISGTYAQAEVQAIADAVAALYAHYGL